MSHSPIGRLCDCGNRAVKWNSHSFACQRCLELEKYDWVRMQELRPRKEHPIPYSRYNGSTTSYEYPHAYIRLVTGEAFGYNYTRWWGN